MSQIKFYFLSLQLICLVLLSGCATTDTRVSLLYEPVGTARGGFGEITLYAPQSSKDSDNPRSRQWQLGNVSDKDGQTIAEVISVRSPETLIIEAFTQELRSSGYNPVTVSNNRSQIAEKGIQILDVSIKLDTTRKFLSDEATCSAVLVVQPLKNGKETRKLRYESAITSSRVSERSQIAADILHKTLQNLMKKSMPDIVKIIEQN